MAVVRRNVVSFNVAEKRELVDAILKLKRNKIYNLFVRSHAQAAGFTSSSSFLPYRLDGAHQGPAFLPWHRVFIRKFELDLQNALGDPNFGLPYFDFTDPAGRNGAVWKDDLMGGVGTPTAKDPSLHDVTGPFRKGAWVLASARGRKSKEPLTRQLDGVDLPALKDIHDLMYEAEYDAPPWGQPSTSGMRNALEGFIPFGLHNRVHVWIGGQMADVPIAPNDPVFFLHHCNIDRIWAQWQKTYGETYKPSSGAAPGHNLDDRMFFGRSFSKYRKKPSEWLSISGQYSYDSYYTMRTVKVVMTAAARRGSLDKLALLFTGKGAPYKVGDLDASHCDNARPFQQGATDTFSLNIPPNELYDGKPATPALFSSFALAGSSGGSWSSKIDSLTIAVDDLPLYENKGVPILLSNGKTSFSAPLTRPKRASP